jgi:UDP-4-amino-4,6-dideoxy-N-acetyl-beta-L-altrosamine transaminase
VKNISYGKQEITAEDIAAVAEQLKGDFLTQGPTVEAFEKAFASYVGSKHAVAVSNGTTALHLCTVVMGVKPGQKVLTTSNTFAASANCVLYCGGDVEFVDIDAKNFCMDLNLLEKKLSNAKAGTYAGIVSVDFAGFPSTREALSQLAKKHRLWIIEDACHAVGAEFKTAAQKWEKVGSANHADLCVFSFHPVKHITTGEGGMICTNDAKLAKRIKLLRSHGIVKNAEDFENKNEGPWFMEMQELGFNYRIPDLLSALGISQLKRIEGNLARRRQIAQNYAHEFKNLPLVAQETSAETKHAYHLYVVQAEKRAELFKHLNSHQIFPQVHYIPVHLHPFYVRRYGLQKFAECEKYYARALSLPMYHSLTESEQAYVIDKVKSFYAK